MEQDKTILLVEDNPDDVSLTLRAFAAHDIASNVAVANNGMDALDYLFGTGEHGGRGPRSLPLVVLLDLKLPKVDGLEVLKRVRAEERTTLLPVVVLTSSSHMRDIRESYALGANSYIRKPVDFVEFSEVVRQLGLYWLAVNEPAPAPEVG